MRWKREADERAALERDKDRLFQRDLLAIMAKSIETLREVKSSALKEPAGLSGHSQTSGAGTSIVPRAQNGPQRVDWMDLLQSAPLEAHNEPRGLTSGAARALCSNPSADRPSIGRAAIMADSAKLQTSHTEPQLDRKSVV